MGLMHSGEDPFFFVVVGKSWPLKGVHAQFLELVDMLSHGAKGAFADMIKVKDLEMERLL